MARVSFYKQEYCNEIVEKAEKGMLMIEIAASWGRPWKTIIEWKKYPEFDEAYNIAKVKCFSFYVRKFIDTINNAHNNPELRYVNERAYGFLFRMISGFSDKSRTINVHGLSDKKSLVEKVDLILKACEDGELTVDELKVMLDSLKLVSEITAVNEFEERIKILEENAKLK